MSKSTRRQFVQQLGGAVAIPALASAPFLTSPEQASAQTPTPQNAAPIYDLLISGGQVIDPAQKLNAQRDIAISRGRIAQIGTGIPRNQARVVVDASGKIVTPGLIDTHVHVFDRIAAVGINPDVIGVQRGVTAMIDAGSSGATTFPGFRKYIVQPAQTRVYALLNISTVGLIILNELYADPAMIDVKAAIRVIQDFDNSNVILGIKVRITGFDADVPHDIDVLKKARVVSDETGIPIELHWSNEPKLLSLLKKGDILVHPYNPQKAGPNLLDLEGRVHPQILELKDRGIFTDSAHGGHVLWETFEKATQQGWFPDLISTDMHRGHEAPNGDVLDLVTYMTKYLYLGMPVDQIIERVTLNPTKAFKFPEKIGTIQVGNTADLSILQLEQGNFILVDSLRQKRTAHQRFLPVATVRAGDLVSANSWVARA